MAAALEHCFGRALEGAQALRVLAPGQDDHVVRDVRQATRKGLALMPPNVFSRDHEDLAALGREESAGVRQYAPFHHCVVTSLGRLHPKSGHTASCITRP